MNRTLPTTRTMSASTPPMDFVGAASAGRGGSR